jgi:flavin reductase (DIM6/NTAB) family NADH-FMN oxidoreductase RutF
MSDSAFDQLVSEVDYPLFVVTAAADGEQAGCLVGFATQASIDPPRLLIMISTANRTWKVARRASHLAVHYLGEDNRDLAALFGEESGDWKDKFTECAWSPGPGGAPLLSGVRGWVAGKVVDRLDGGDHVGHLIDVEEAGLGASMPLLTHRSLGEISPGHPA